MKAHLTLTTAVFVCAPAFAQTPDPSQADPAISSLVFNVLDVNKDGRLSESEAQASPALRAQLSSADTNGDGMISRQEFSAAFDSGALSSTPSAPSEPDRPKPQR